MSGVVKNIESKSQCQFRHFEVSCSQIPHCAFAGIRTHGPLVESDVLAIRHDVVNCNVMKELQRHQSPSGKLCYQESPLEVDPGSGERGGARALHVKKHK
jgi:hypothetical protein